MKTRLRWYTLTLRWTAIPLLVLVWLMLITGPGVFKGDILSRTTLGLIDPASAGKWHSVWLPSLTAGVLYLHTTMGLLALANRVTWLRPKWLWEIVAWLIGLLGAAQFYWLYYG